MENNPVIPGNDARLRRGMYRQVLLSQNVMLPFQQFQYACKFNCNIKTIDFVIISKENIK